MAPLRRQNSQYVFQYSVPLEAPGRPTRIVYRSPSAPYRARGIRPALTAVYKNTPQVSSRRRLGAKRNSTPDRDPPPSSSARQRATLSPSPTPPPSPIIPPASPAHRARSSSRARTPDPAFESASSASRAQRSGVPITRSASRSSVRNDSSSASRTGASHLNKRPHPPGPTVSLWTRFGIKNGSPTFVRRDRTSSSTDRDCVTTYYESFSRDEIRSPPDLSDDPQLEEGDVYINTVYDIGLPQMWIWSKDGGKVAFWKVAKEGDVRQDGRRLSITPKLGLPSWVKPEWCVRQMLKQQKAK